jgi:hypothetical protein
MDLVQAQKSYLRLQGLFEKGGNKLSQVVLYFPARRF